MRSKLIRLFQRYCDHHFAIEVPGFAIVDMQGRKLGQVERICFGISSVRLEGWTIAAHVGLGKPGQTTLQKPDILRPDVNSALGLDPSKRTGFNLVCYGDSNGVLLSLKDGRELLQMMCPATGRMHRLRAAVHIRIAFARALCRSAPALARAAVSPKAENRARAKRVLGLEAGPSSFALNGALLKTGKPAAARFAPPRKITLVMPVYNAFDVLRQALQRISQNTDISWRLVLVEDCSTDQRVRPMLRSWSTEQRALGREIILIEQGENQGFIKSVNRAFQTALRFSDHVVLLNSDALVPPSWASRLLHPIAQDARVASVTPLSNDAEIFNVPQACARSDVSASTALAIDAALSQNMSLDAAPRAPTGVGFCMAINIRHLRRRPAFDTIFGKGYGEEVDWCQRTAQDGALHLVQPALFVEHRGGESFGDASKQAAIARNNQIVSRRYPHYDKSVQHFIADDPLRTARVLGAAASLAAEQEHVPIYIAHTLGGGAELYLREQLKKGLDKAEGAIVLRLGGHLRWRIEVHTAQGLAFGDTDSTSLMHRMLSPVANRHVVYSCAVGDRDPVQLPAEILKLREAGPGRLTVLMHDYFSISPSYCLLDSGGVFTDVPPLGTDDVAHSALRPNGLLVSNKEWRRVWGEVLGSADEIRCFSQSSARIVQTAYPQLGPSCTVVPHEIGPVPKLIPAARNAPFVLGVLGDIGAQKGAAIVEKISTSLPSYGLRSLVVVGRVDPRFELGAACIETGAYKRADITTLAENHKISCWLIPSIWPETFSYTTHEALATGLPVFAFDIGAQGEAVQRASNGHPLPFEWQSDAKRILEQIEQVVSHGAKHRTSDQRPEASGHRGFAA